MSLNFLYDILFTFDFIWLDLILLFINISNFKLALFKYFEKI